MIAKFEGAYHGIDDPALISYLPPLGPELGPAERPLPVAASAGLAPGTAEHVLVLPFNDGEACEALLREHGDRLAAVIVDPLATAAGMTLPAPGFLETLRSVTGELGIVLIFDEVVSFPRRPRRHAGGVRHPARPYLPGEGGGRRHAGRRIRRARRHHGAVRPDRRQRPAIPQSGTYNGNPIVMAAGLAPLRTMTDAAYGEIHDRTARLGEGLRQVFSDTGVPGCVVTAGSLFQLYFLAEAPRNYREAAQDDGARQRWLYFWLMNHGIVTRRGGNVSLPMTDRHVERLIEEVGNRPAPLAVVWCSGPPKLCCQRRSAAHGVRPQPYQAGGAVSRPPRRRGDWSTARGMRARNRGAPHLMSITRTRFGEVDGLSRSTAFTCAIRAAPARRC